MDDIKQSINSIRRECIHYGGDSSLYEGELIKLKAQLDAHYKRPEGVYKRIRDELIKGIPDGEFARAVRGIIHQSKQQFNARKEEAEKKVEARNAKQVIFTADYITGRVQELLLNPSLEARITLLMLASGARKCEILYASEFHPTASWTEKGWILQESVSKKKRRVFAFKRVIFLTSEGFLAILRQVRHELKSKRSLKSLSMALEKFSASLWPQSTLLGHRTGTHINRAIHANYSYHFHRSPGQSLAHFIKEALVHDSLGPAANYMNICISWNYHDSDWERAVELEEQTSKAKISDIKDACNAEQEEEVPE